MVVMSAKCSTVLVVQLLLVTVFVLFGPKPASLYIETPYVRSLQLRNPILEENRKIGTRIWWSNQTDVDPLIEGFTTQFSYEANNTASFKISIASMLFGSSPHIRVQLWIFRMGFYNGLGGRLVGNVSFTETTTQPNCLYEVSSRMVDCDNWHESVEWFIPGNAVSGIYVAIPALYKEENGKQVEVRGTFIPFVIRKTDSINSSNQRNINDVPINKIGSDILFKTSDMTWVIYNKYGGWNLYRGNGTYTFDSRARRASYNRPFQNRQYKPQGQFENFLFGAEYPLLYWLEKHGFDVSYASCNDIEKMNKNKKLLPDNYRILLSVGHDEYYTQELRDSYVTARENGINLAFFSANEIFWRTRWENEKQISKNVKHVRTAGHGNLSLSFFSSAYDKFNSNNRAKIKISNFENLNISPHLKNEKIKINRVDNKSNSVNISLHNQTKLNFRNVTDFIDNSKQKTKIEQITIRNLIENNKLINMQNTEIKMENNKNILMDLSSKDKENHDNDKYVNNNDSINNNSNKNNYNDNKNDNIDNDEKNNNINYNNYDNNNKNNDNINDNNIINVKSNRILICAKETIDGKITPNSNPKKDWTGTFSDPRFRTPEPENSLTGQKFAVNGFRSDFIEISENDVKLRFWRNTDLALGAIKMPYRTQTGLLGYEWDIFSDDCHRPEGLISLSGTTKKIKKGLSENFGASYGGTDIVTHKLSLYRYICNTDNYRNDQENSNNNDRNNYAETKNKTFATIENGSEKLFLRKMNDRDENITNSNITINNHEHSKNNNKTKKKTNINNNYYHNNNYNFHNYKSNKDVKSSLVFGAGTLQWSWALSDFHDGPYVRENQYLQQATINIFADMNVQPGKLRNENENETENETDNENENEDENRNRYRNKNRNKNKKRNNDIGPDFLRKNKNHELKLGSISTDSRPPISIIDYPKNLSVIDLQEKKTEFIDKNNMIKERSLSQKHVPIVSHHGKNILTTKNKNNSTNNDKIITENKIMINLNKIENIIINNDNKDKNLIKDKNLNLKMDKSKNDLFLIITGRAFDRGGGEVEILGLKILNY